MFPGVICVFAGRPKLELERRLTTMLAFCAEDPELTATPQVGISLCLLDDLTDHGPFAGVWQRPDQPGTRLDWLGHPASDNSGGRGPAR